MANKALFENKTSGRTPPVTNTHNNAGGVAYAFDSKHKLAQYACTGVFNGTYYSSAEEQLDEILKLLPEIDVSFIAKTALYARQSGFMKDMPAFLLAHLTTRGEEGRHCLENVFNKVINNGKMLRNFVQFMRSGTIGRKSLGSAPKRLVRNWILNRDPERLFKDSVGNDPSMADLIKMVHPTPKDKKQESLFAYIIGKKRDDDNLPELIKQYERFKNDTTAEVPDVPFQMIASLDIKDNVWIKIAQNAHWQMTRMNLNTFSRHGVLKDKKMVDMIANRLADPKLIRDAMVFPYQLFCAYMNTKDVPIEISLALQDALEISLSNIPEIDGNVVVCPDVSGSMGSPATGHRQGSTSSMRCIDIAALVAAAMLRNNPKASVMPFEGRVVDLVLNPRDSVMTNATKLASIGGGSTCCAAPLAKLNATGAKVDLVLYVSDNQSWINSGGFRYGNGTDVMQQWEILKSRNPKAKMVCIDIQPYGNSQSVDRDDIINIGGFSDSVFDVISSFVKGDKSHWVDVINKLLIED